MLMTGRVHAKTQVWLIDEQKRFITLWERREGGCWREVSGVHLFPRTGGIARSGSCSHVKIHLSLSINGDTHRGIVGAGAFSHHHTSTLHCHSHTW